MIRFGTTLTILFGASLRLAGCSDSIETGGNDTGSDGPGGDTTATGTTGGSGNTFDHEDDSISVWDLINRLSVEGPPSFTSHMHSCSKVRYATLGNVLTSLGVNTADTTAFSSGALYKAAATSMGVANYTARIRESITLSTSGMSAAFDIYAAGAKTITDALTTATRCQVAGAAGPALFDASNKCNIDAITCLIGQPATQGHVDICNLSVTKASTPDIGKQIAVAALLAAAYTCE
ncbi:MAG TPA: hypothetical protein VGC42_21900 [Kofleriaceae bacterium]